MSLNWGGFLSIRRQCIYRSISQKETSVFNELALLSRLRVLYVVRERERACSGHLLSGSGLAGMKREVICAESSHLEGHGVAGGA